MNALPYQKEKAITRNTAGESGGVDHVSDIQARENLITNGQAKSQSCMAVRSRLTGLSLARNFTFWHNEVRKTSKCHHSCVESTYPYYEEILDATVRVDAEHELYRWTNAGGELRVTVTHTQTKQAIFCKHETCI